MNPLLKHLEDLQKTVTNQKSVIDKSLKSYSAMEKEIKTNKSKFTDEQLKEFNKSKEMIEKAKKDLQNI